MRKRLKSCWLSACLLLFASSSLQAQEGKLKSYLNSFQDYEYSDVYLAKIYLDSATQILPEIQDPKLIGDYYIHEGWYFQDIAKYEKSRESFFKALKEYQSINAYQQIADAYGNIGNAYFDVDELSNSLKYHQKSLVLNEKIAFSATDSLEIDLAERGKAYAYTNLAAIYYILKDYDKSMEFEKASLNYEIQRDDSLGMAISYQGIGELYESMGQVDSAYYYLEYSKDLFEKDQYSYGLIRSLISLSHLEKDSVTARNYLLRALDIAIESNDNFSEISLMGKLLNENFNLPKQTHDLFVQRILNIQQDTVIARKTYRVYRSLGSYYYRNNQFKKSSEAYQTFISSYLKDQEVNEKSELKSELIRNELQLKAFTDSLKIQTEYAEKSLEDERKINKQKTIITIAIAGGVLLLGMTFFLFKSIKTKNKNNRLLNAKNQRIQDQKELVDEKNKQITDSINYAKRLQSAILPHLKDVQNEFSDLFVLFKPKDVVSGDFYWFEKKKDLLFIAASDCTGHGVPGAMVSVVCSNALNRAVNEFNLVSPSKILDKTRDIVIETFAKSGEDVKDGMDISLCCIDKSSKTIIFSGANNPLWICRKSENVQHKEGSEIEQNGYTLLEYKGDKQPVGLYSAASEFKEVTVEYFEQDTFYLFTDGYADQFGGDEGKKLKYKTFKKMLLSQQGSDLSRQSQYFDEFINKWMGPLEQIDDICVIGFKP